MTTGTRSYPDLLQIFLPRPITTEAQYDATVSQMNQLIDRGTLTPDEEDLLTLLGTVVSLYEDEHYPDEQFELHGLTLIKALMNENNLKQKDLVPIFKTKSIVSAVLNGKRPLTVNHISGLAAFFDLPHELFFD